MKNKQRLILLMILIIVVVAAMFIMSQEIIAQNNEIIALKERVHNLEFIIHRKLVEQAHFF